MTFIKDWIYYGRLAGDKTSEKKLKRGQRVHIKMSEKLERDSDQQEIIQTHPSNPSKHLSNQIATKSLLGLLKHLPILYTCETTQLQVKKIKCKND